MYIFSLQQQWGEVGKKGENRCDKISTPDSAVSFPETHLYSGIDLKGLVSKPVCETFPYLCSITSGPDPLLTNKSLLLSSLGDLRVFPRPNFCPSALVWPCLCQGTAILCQPVNSAWASLFSRAGAILSPGLHWNWSKNTTDNKAELWFTSKLRVG